MLRKDRFRAMITMLVVINMLIAMAIMLITGRTVMADGLSYLALADGIRHGNYSQYWQVGLDIPDTTRTPGLPMFFAVIMAVSGTEDAIKWVHLGIYLLAILLSLKVISRITDNKKAQILFLLLLILLANVPLYIAQAYPEIPSLGAIALILYTLTRPGGITLGQAIAVGLLHGAIFQFRPIYLLFPFCLAAVAFIIDRRGFHVYRHALVLLVYGATLLPYGWWNLKHHDVFKVTPLESGAGVAHIGFWAGKIPGYTEHFHWGNTTGDEILRFVPEDSIPNNIAEYEREWRAIKQEIAPLLSARDSLMLRSQRRLDRPVMSTFNSEYVKAQERLLWDRTLEHCLNEPGYLIRYKLYSMVRLWVIGVDRSDFLQADLKNKLKQLLPLGYTLFLFLLMVILLPVALNRDRGLLQRTYPMLLYLLYFGLIHVPFALQARYTTPVRLVMLIMISLSAISLLGGRSIRAVIQPRSQATCSH